MTTIYIILVGASAAFLITLAALALNKDRIWFKCPNCNLWWTDTGRHETAPSPYGVAAGVALCDDCARARDHIEAALMRKAE